MKNNNIWYAVMMDREDNDWGTGSYDLEEAIAMVRKYRASGDTEASISL